MASTETQKVTEADKAEAARKAEAEAKVASLNPEQMLTRLTEATTEATTAREAKADSPEAKVAKAARVLLTVPDLFGAEVPKATAKWLTEATTLSPEGFDRMEGDLLASILSSLAGIPESFRPAGFDKVADKVTEAVDAWQATRPGRRSGNGSGESTTPASQKLATFGIKAIRLTMSSDKLAEAKVVEHGSTWSSLSAEINKVAKVIDGKTDAAPGSYSYQDVDKASGPAWRAYVESVKAKPNASSTFTVKLAKGTLTVKAEGIPA